jgi:predicted phosphodiesterase
MNFREKLENTKLHETIAKLRVQLNDSNKQQSMILGQLEKARSAKFKPIPQAKVRAKLKGDKVRVTVGDVHGCNMDREAVAALLADVRRIQPHEIFLMGDIVNCGTFLAQHHTLGYVAETTETWEDDIRAANWFLDQLRLAAPNAVIIYIEGNHEQRIERWSISVTMRAGGHASDAQALLDREGIPARLSLKQRAITFYRMAECYDGLTVPGFIRRGKLFYTHGSFVTSKHATRDIQSKVTGNVVFGNTHRAQAEVVRKVNVGVIGAWNPGCVCKLQPLWLNTNPTDWTLGYGLEFIARSENFLHINMPLIGESLLSPFLESAHETNR